jgi:hypothetical protein
LETKSKRLSSNPEALAIIAKGIESKLSDKDIQKALVKKCGYKWTTDTIGRRRRAIVDASKIKPEVIPDGVDAPMMTVPPYGLNESETAVWFREQFKNSHLYPTIKRQLEQDEIIVYINDFGLLCCQFADIVVSEFMQIDDFLKHRILVDRQLVLGRSLQRQIDILGLWFIENPKKEDEDKDTIKFRLMQQRQMDDFYKQLKVVNDRYDTLVKERARIYSGLNATRKDRLDELKGGKETFLDLVGKLQHSQTERDRHGRFAELTKLAAKDVADNFRKPNEFPDGTVAPIIMDSRTKFSGDGVDTDE